MLAAMVRNEGRMREVIDGGKGSSRFRKNRPGGEEVGEYDALERGRGRGEGGGAGIRVRWSGQVREQVCSDTVQDLSSGTASPAKRNDAQREERKEC